MDEDIEVIIKGCNNADYSREEQADFSDEYGKTRVWKVQGEDSCLFYWNSSNGQAPKHSTALAYIAEELEEGSQGGSVNDGWNEIMFEIK
jgi:hypothetical protein